jgi:hypothetical protein
MLCRILVATTAGGLMTARDIFQYGLLPTIHTVWKIPWSIELEYSDVGNYPIQKSAGFLLADWSL